MQFQRPEIGNVVSYLYQVKHKFVNQPEVNKDFLDIVKESIDRPSQIHRVSTLFRGHPELIEGLNTILPPKYHLEVQPNEEVQVSIPGTNVAGGQGATSSTIHPTGQPSASVHPVPQTNTERDAAPHDSPVAKPPPVANSQPHANSQNQHPPHSEPGRVSPATGNSPNSASASARNTISFNDGINYVERVKDRFQGQPEIYAQFLELLRTFKVDSQDLEDGVKTAEECISEEEVYDKVAELFRNHWDLVHEFGAFIQSGDQS